MSENEFATHDDEEIDIEDSAEEEDSGISHSRYLITSYGVDYTVDSLVERVIRDDIYVPTFQRSYVWTFPQACRFIDSLLRGLPVPGIFLSKDEERRLVVIDGQQRLLTLRDFFKGVFRGRKEFALQSDDDRFDGKTYEMLDAEDKRQLNDSILHATIIQQLEPEDDDSSIYHIFERLNTGGTKLTSQEIRASIYHGEFNDLLGELNEYEPWRALYGNRSKRGKDQELILRFLALYYGWAEYVKPMNEFLNRFMRKYRNLDNTTATEFSDLFRATIGAIQECLGRVAFRPVRGLNAAVFDAVMIGIARRLDKRVIQDCESVQKRYDSLLADKKFITAYTSSTTDNENVKARLDLATRAFAKVS